MMNAIKQNIFIFLAICLFAGGTPSCIKPNSRVVHKDLKVLFIGNSYTYGNDLPELLAQLMAGRGIKLQYESVTVGGATLAKHWADGKAKEAIHKQTWDFVILQEQSTYPFSKRDSFFKYARLLAAETKTTVAKPVFYMTWAAKAHPDEQPKLTEAYRTIAKETGSLIAPVGDAWKIAIANGMDLHGSDGRHPNLKGSYLAGCVIYRALTGKTALKLPRQLMKEGKPRGGLSVIQADSLQRISNKMVLK